MKILGVCNANVSGAALLINGAVIASVNEERFSRIKNHRTFPVKSITYCLEHANLNASDIDYVVCGAWGGVDETFLPQVIEELLHAVTRDHSAVKIINDRTRVAIERDHYYKNELRENLAAFGFPLEKEIECFDHHLSHAFTAFYPSPFEEALVLTIDGRGDFKSATISRANRTSGIQLLDSVSMYSSIGAFYGFITAYLGFTPDRHEGKVTGLAAFGNPSTCLPVLQRMITYRDGRIVANIGKHYSPFLTGKLPAIEKELAKFSREDIAAAVQKLTEDLVITYLTQHLECTKLRNVCLAGGVFGNVKLNQKILELAKVDNIYVFPQMGDGGNAFGAALIKLYQLGHTFRSPLKHAYWGPSYSTAEIYGALQASAKKVTWEPLEAYTIQRVASELAAGLIVGIFTGRMEYGPRALGARSILAQATEQNINTTLNDRLHRTEFMPFAPVTLEDYADSYYKGWKREQLCSHFMTVCYECTERARRESPAIVHVDNTARPQIINHENTYPLYYNVLKEYHKKTGIPTLINTSFNNHEEPIVCSPNDAINSLLLGNVDYVIIENFVVKKK